MLYEELAAELLKYQFVLLRKEGNKNNIDILRGKKRVIGYLYEVKDGVYPSVLSSFMGVSTARIACILNKLEDDKIINRLEDKKDKRCKLVYLTDEGRSLGASYQKKYIKEISTMLRALGEHDAKEHVRITKKIFDLTINGDINNETR